MGSLIGAVASYLDAKANRGLWLVRMEDLDPPREMAGAAEAILQCLQAHGMQWDGEVLWQSQRHQVYQQTIEQLLDEGKAFYCTCSRTDLQTYGGIYPGICRGHVSPPNHQEFAIRLQVTDEVVGVDDEIQGHYQQQLAKDVGDFVLKRKDGLFAYQLAVVVDDAEQGVTHVMRGSDLLDSTPRQMYLQQQLNLPTVHYSHFPVLVNSDGQKLSKQTFAPALGEDAALGNMQYALHFLRQSLPNNPASVAQLMEWAQAHWDVSVIPRCLQLGE